jgi:hypothetical protein
MERSPVKFQKSASNMKKKKEEHYKILHTDSHF